MTPAWIVRWSRRRRGLEGDAALVLEVREEPGDVLAGPLYVSGEPPDRLRARDVELDVPVRDLVVEVAESFERVLQRSRCFLLELLDQVGEPPVRALDVGDTHGREVDVAEVLDLALQPLGRRAEPRRLRGRPRRAGRRDLVRPERYRRDERARD